MKEELYQRFIKKLQEKYGPWKKETSKLGESSFGAIADDLCISKSQFTMLISGKGTEGMYTRSIRNVEQLIKYDLQSLELAEKSVSKRDNNIPKLLGLLILGALLGWMAKNLLSSAPVVSTELSSLESHPLTNYFEGNFKEDYVSPYLKETEVQSFCPCSAYEGVWKLAEEYIIPLPSKKPGIYYLAKSSDVRIKCYKGAKKEKQGKVMIGFENMHNEIWVDKNRTSFSPKYFDLERKSYTTEFSKLSFESNPSFIKVADVYSCFYDQFTIDSEFISRTGEPCGRYAKNINKEAVDEFKIDVRHLLENVISSMAQIECNVAQNENCNPNSITEGESIMQYNCMFKIKTENLGIGGGYPYQKTYLLVKQNYSDNLLCDCPNSEQ